MASNFGKMPVEHGKILTFGEGSKTMSRGIMMKLFQERFDDAPRNAEHSRQFGSAWMLKHLLEILHAMGRD